MLTEKPAWVTEFAWETYKNLHADGWSALGVDNKEIDSLLNDPHLEKVWKAITKREALSPCPTVSSGFYLPLICFLASGLVPEQQVPRIARQDQGKRIAKHARNLRNALEEAKLSNYWPAPICAAISEYAVQKEIERGNDGKGKNANDWTRTVNGWKQNANPDPNVAIEDLQDALDALRKAGDVWAGWDSGVSQIENKNADRLLFIRSMTKSFRAWYNQPLRECVADLTRHFFKTDIDAATVAKLAP